MAIIDPRLGGSHETSLKQGLLKLARSKVIDVDTDFHIQKDSILAAQVTIRLQSLTNLLVKGLHTVARQTLL